MCSQMHTVQTVNVVLTPHIYCTYLIFVFQGLQSGFIRRIVLLEPKIQTGQSIILIFTVTQLFSELTENIFLSRKL